MEDDHYVIRAELPGIDPDKDVKITVDEHTLVIDAERTGECTDKTRTEFQYGSFHRAMSLPADVKTGDVTATYTDGILTVSIGITKRIEVSVVFGQSECISKLFDIAFVQRLPVCFAECFDVIIE